MKWEEQYLCDRVMTMQIKQRMHSRCVTFCPAGSKSIIDAIRVPLLLFKCDKENLSKTDTFVPLSVYKNHMKLRPM